MSAAIVVIGLTVIGVALALFSYLRTERRKEARKWARYAASGREPKSIVCPTCHRRSYAERAVRDRWCPYCEKPHDAPPRTEPVLRIVA